MLNKTFTLVSAAILSLLLLSGATNAAIFNINPFNLGDEYNNTVNVAGNGGVTIDDTYNFTGGYDGNAIFIVDTSFAAGGVKNLVFTWLNGSGNSVIFTDGAGVEIGIANNIFFEAMVNGVVRSLKVTGEFINSGASNYTVNVSTVPLPPAVIAFGTAMLGVGFLARRKRKKKEVFS